MDEFIISGSFKTEMLASLKGSFFLLYCILCSPIALIIKKYSERKVFRTMKQYQPFKKVAPNGRVIGGSNNGAP